MKCPKFTCMLYGRCVYPTACVGDKPARPWTGPLPGEVDAVGRLRAHVPADRWPFGPPDRHESTCMLHEHAGDGAYCDCAASAGVDRTIGVAS